MSQPTDKTLTFCERLEQSCSSRGDAVAMRVVGSDSDVLTFKETFQQIRSVAYKLKAEGVESGDRVALIGENHPCWAVAYLGIIYSGAVCVPIDPNGETNTIANFIQNSEAKLLFISPELREKIPDLEQKTGRSLRAIEWRSKITGIERFEDWTSEVVPDSWQHVPPKDPGAMAILIYTSGTTGTPKGVPLTHGNIVAELDGVNNVLEITPKERLLSLLPLFHAYLQIANLWIAITKGCEVGYLRELSPQELSYAMREFKPTMLTTVPRLWYLFHKKIFDAIEAKPRVAKSLIRALLRLNGFLRDTIKLNLGTRLFSKVHEGFGGQLDKAISAGSRFDSDVALDFHRLGFTILQGYGLTETSGAATATYVEDNRVGSVGKPVFNAEVKISNPDHEGIGEVLIRGPIVFAGYYHNAEANQEAFTEDGWFRSGDLGRFDRDGHLYIVGRAKDVIVLPNGKNVHPEDLEVHYLKTPLVAELAVIGVEDESLGHSGAEKLVAVVVPDFDYMKSEGIANTKEVIRFALDSLGRDLPEYQRVREYIVRAEPLPRTATRKIRRFELRKEVLSGALVDSGITDTKKWVFTPADTQTVSSPAGVMILSLIKGQKNIGDAIHPDMNLEIDLGLDSLARAEIIAGIQMKLGIEMTAEEAAEILTVREVINFVGSRVDENLIQTSGETISWNEILQSDENVPEEVLPILKSNRAGAFMAFVVMKIAYLFFRIFLRLEVRGLGNLKNLDAPFIICPNHQSFLDAFVLCSTYDFKTFSRIFHVGTSEIFGGPLMSRLAGLIRVVPIDPDTSLIQAMRAGAIGLRSGRILNIYPEGERGFDGTLHPFKNGAAILASELGIPIVPVAMDGLYKVWPRDSNRIRPGKVVLSICPPMKTSENEGINDYSKVTGALKARIEDELNCIRTGS
jgi:long-chain acyl-CoA synthetase